MSGHVIGSGQAVAICGTVGAGFVTGNLGVVVSFTWTRKSWKPA